MDTFENDLNQAFELAEEIRKGLMEPGESTLDEYKAARKLARLLGSMKAGV